MSRKGAECPSAEVKDDDRRNIVLLVFQGVEWLERTVSQRIVDRVDRKGVGGLKEQRKKKMQWKEMTFQGRMEGLQPIVEKSPFGDILEREGAQGRGSTRMSALSRRHLGLHGLVTGEEGCRYGSG